MNYELAILIPSRSEMFLQNTIEDALKNIEAGIIKDGIVYVNFNKLKQEAKEVILDIIKHQKNPLKAFMEFHNLTQEDFK